MSVTSRKISGITNWLSNAMKQKNKLLVLGIGNLLKKDDGIGVHVIQYLQDNNIHMPDNVDLLDGGIAGFDLIQHMMHYDRIIIIDALKIQDKPGSIYKFNAKHLIVKSPNVSLHELGIAEVLELLKIKGASPEVEVIGVVPEDIDSLDMTLSPSIEESIPKVVDLILDSVTVC